MASKRAKDEGELFDLLAVNSMPDLRAQFGKVRFEEPNEDFSISTAQTDRSRLQETIVNYCMHKFTLIHQMQIFFFFLVFSACINLFFKVNK